MTILKHAATALYGLGSERGRGSDDRRSRNRRQIIILPGVGFPGSSDYNLCNASRCLRLSDGRVVHRTQILRLRPILTTMDGCSKYVRVDTYWLGKPLRNVFNHVHSLNLQGERKLSGIVLI